MITDDQNWITGFTRSGDSEVDFCQPLPTFTRQVIPSLQFPMTFSEYYSEVLLPFIERYKTAKNDKERKAVSRNAAEAVKKSHDLREDEAMDLPKDLETVCLSFILSLSLLIYMNSGHQ